MADHEFLSPEFIPQDPYSGLAVTSGVGRGVIANTRDGLGLAIIIARKGQITALAQRVRERFGIDLPRGAQRVAGGDIAFAATGPGIWLAMQENGSNDFVLSLERDIGTIAAISDQSDGYAVLRLTGPKVRDALAKLIPIDVHARSFKPGDVASTIASHLDVTLWRLSDAADGAPVFDLAVYRSLTASFWHALLESSAEFGLELLPGRDWAMAPRLGVIAHHGARTVRDRSVGG